MKLRLCFFMLALGICGAVVQGCDDNDDNLDVLDKLQAAFSQKYPEASPKWKTELYKQISILCIHIVSNRALTGRYYPNRIIQLE